MCQIAANEMVERVGPNALDWRTENSVLGTSRSTHGQIVGLL
jgi:hypothetical protein